MAHQNYPIEDCAATAERLIADGCEIFQKFTCAKCGSRQVMGEPNKFFTSGKCEECGGVTDIAADGCNYVVVGRGDRAAAAIFREHKR